MTASRIGATALASTCLAIGTLLGGSVSAWAGSDTSEISACYSNTNGILRILAPDGQCRPDETAIEWNHAGTPGPVGPQGPTGPGLTGIEQVSDASPFDSADVKTLDVGCPAGKVVLTGGARVAANTFQPSATVFLNWSAPLAITGETAPTRWVARAGEATLSDLDWSLVVWVWCVNDPRQPRSPRPSAHDHRPHREGTVRGSVSAVGQRGIGWHPSTRVLLPGTGDDRGRQSRGILHCW